MNRHNKKQDDENNKDHHFAAAAGVDTWKTWAGRNHGGDNFINFDLIRGAQRKFVKFRARMRTKVGCGGLCPVCYCKPDQWYVTSCGHAVCIECLREYSASLLKDPGYHRPLKCPVCAGTVRKKDAIVALKDNDGILKTLDNKLRDEFLRALPSFRLCPQCSGCSADGTQMLMGGGYVTPECLSSLRAEREQDAEKMLDLIPTYHRLLAISCIICFRLSFHSGSVINDFFRILMFPLLDFFWVLMFFRLLDRRLHLFGDLVVAKAARRALTKPIEVACPCCSESFILDTEAELSPTQRVFADKDKASAEWITSNTRPCPNCSVPIQKIGGCNSMLCGHCHAYFYWDSMRPRNGTNTDYNNQAHYRNSQSTGRAQDKNLAGQLMSNIIRIETGARLLGPTNEEMLLFLLYIIYSLRSN